MVLDLDFACLRLQVLDDLLKFRQKRRRQMAVLQDDPAFVLFRLLNESLSFISLAFTERDRIRYLAFLLSCLFNGLHWIITWS